MLVGWLAGWDPIRPSDIALASTLLSLLSWRVTLVRADRHGPLPIVGTLVLDIVVAPVLALRLRIK